MATLPPFKNATEQKPPAKIADLRSISSVRNAFPSDAHWAAIESISIIPQAMANGTAPQRQVYLSSVDCGMGKSSTVIACARSLLTPDIDVGMLLCVSRKRGAETMADLATTGLVRFASTAVSGYLYLDASKFLIRVASASTAKGLVRICMPWARCPFPITAFSA
jgi:hypothetical protein